MRRHSRRQTRAESEKHKKRQKNKTHIVDSSDLYMSKEKYSKEKFFKNKRRIAERDSKLEEYEDDNQV